MTSLIEAIAGNSLTLQGLVSPLTPVNIPFDKYRTTVRVIANWSVVNENKVLIGKKPSGITTTDSSLVGFGKTEMYPVKLRKLTDDYYFATIEDPNEWLANNGGTPLAENAKKYYCHALDMVMYGTKPRMFHLYGLNTVHVATEYEGYGAFTCAYDDHFIQGEDYAPLSINTKHPYIINDSQREIIYLHGKMIPEKVGESLSNLYDTKWTLTIDVASYERKGSIATILKGEIDVLNSTIISDSVTSKRTSKFDLAIRNIENWKFSSPSIGDPGIHMLDGIQIWGIGEMNDLTADIYYEGSGERPYYNQYGDKTEIRRKYVAEHMFGHRSNFSPFTLYPEVKQKLV